jgi:hypothetical protein
MLHFIPQCHQDFSFSVLFIQAQFVHMLGVIQAGVYILRCYCDVSIPAINIRTTATAAETMIPETSWWSWSWVSTVLREYWWCHLPFSAGGCNGSRIKGIVTYAHIGALSRFGYTVFHASLPFYSTMPACVLRGNHKRCHLCRGNSSRHGPYCSALRLRAQTRDAKRAVSTVAQMGGDLTFLIAASGRGSVKWKGEL